MEIREKSLLSEKEFNEFRNIVLESSYEEIVNNVFPKYSCGALELESLKNFGSTIMSDSISEMSDSISEIRYLYEHVNTHYWNLSWNIKQSINDAHIVMNDHNGYIVAKFNFLRISFIQWLSLYDSVKSLIVLIDKNICDIKEVKKIIEKYSDKKHSKDNTMYLDFSDFKDFPIFENEKWKMTFRDFANDIKHNDNLLVNLEYELIMKSMIKERKIIDDETSNECIRWGSIKINAEHLNKFFYNICITSLIEATDDLVIIANLVLDFLKEESKLKRLFLNRN